MEQRNDRTASWAEEAASASLPMDATHMLLRFLKALDGAFLLSEPQRIQMRNDFVRGIDALSATGMPFAEILRRLDPSRLHGFYARPREGYYPLDGGAKQYPLAMLNGQMAMFRLTATLDVPVNPALLQLALTFTLRRFPHYATRLRRGAFWYYLKPLTARYAVLPETGAVCAPIDVSVESEPLFRVLHSGCRVSVELLHILSDGMGGMAFLKSLLTEYYRLLGEDGAGEDAQALDSGAFSHPEELENSFARFAGRGRGERLIGTPAVQLPAKRLSTGEIRVDQYALSAEELKKSAHAYGVSVTALMSAVILDACRGTAQARTGRYKLQIPVDLRRSFPSRTLRNYSWYGALNSDAETPLSGAELTLDLHRQILDLTRQDALERSVSAAQRAIRVLRFVPLPWKTLLLRGAYRMAGDFFFTSTLSNLGVIALHAPLEAHIREIAAVLGPSPSNPYVFALATVHGRTVLSVTRTADDAIMTDRLFRSASAYGLTLMKKGTRV